MKTLQMNRRHLIEQRKNRHAVHHRGFKQKPFAARRGQVAQFAVRMHDGSFVRGDGVGSVLKRRANVVDGGLAIFHVERGRFEEDVSLGASEPFADVLGGGL